MLKSSGSKAVVFKQLRISISKMFPSGQGPLFKNHCSSASLHGLDSIFDPLPLQGSNSWGNSLELSTMEQSHFTIFSLATQLWKAMTTVTLISQLYDHTSSFLTLSPLPSPELTSFLITINILTILHRYPFEMFLATSYLHLPDTWI